MAGKRSPSRFSTSRQPPVITPLGVDLPELQQARALWMRNRFEEAIQLFETTAQRFPQNMLAQIDAARALGTRFEIPRALPMAERLAHAAGRNGRLWLEAGQTFRMLFRPARAIECFQKAVALDPTLADAHLELAVYHERRHQLVEAMGCVDRCLAARPGYAEAELIRGRLLRRSGEAVLSNAALRSLAEGDGTHPLVRAQAWVEIAQQQDRDADFPQAWESMGKAKALLMPLEGTLLEESRHLSGVLRSIVSAMQPGLLESWQRSLSVPPRRVALLAGFPRSGTTLLEQALDAHPSLVSSDEREAFARDIFPAIWSAPGTRLPTMASLAAAPPERIATQRERYWRFMEAALGEPIGDRVHLDKNPGMTLLIPGMLRLFPELKVIFALRDPRDVVLSCYFQYLPLNTNSVCYLTLERAVDRYIGDMEAWLELRKVIPASQWLEVRYESLVGDLPSEVSRVLGFLGLPWDASVLSYRDRLRSKPVQSPTYEAVAQPVYRSAIGRWKNYEAAFQPHLARLRGILDAFDCRMGLTNATDECH